MAQIFFAVYETAIDTTLLAFCEDCETNGGNPKWAPPLLMEAMGLDANDSKPAPPPGFKGNAVAPEPVHAGGPPAGPPPATALAPAPAVAQR